MADTPPRTLWTLRALWCPASGRAWTLMAGQAGRRRPSMAATWTLGRWGARMARVGDVQDDPNLSAGLHRGEEPLVMLWCGLERTDLSPAAARQLAIYLRMAAGRAERR